MPERPRATDIVELMCRAFVSEDPETGCFRPCDDAEWARIGEATVDQFGPDMTRVLGALRKAGLIREP